ncbi:hypothetical protein [Streptomyces sp. NPDC048650]|uniref:hypothetical protein n=1 Tax=unclassified Streptomyces TaxID=2593676 RepID=UPI00371E6B90
MRIRTVLAAVALAATVVLGGASVATADDDGASHKQGLLHHILDDLGISAVPQDTP